MATYYSCDLHEKLNIQKPDKIDDCMAQQKLQCLALAQFLIAVCMAQTCNNFQLHLYVVKSNKIDQIACMRAYNYFSL